MNVKIIGIGAAGNKAAIETAKLGIVNTEDILLMNTAIQDIPELYKGRSIIFSNKTSAGGCGKERNRSKDFITDFISDGDNLAQTLNHFILPGDLPVVVTSTEGGTGSGAAPIVAAYIDEVVGTRPQLIAFTGTEDDIRGLQNTLDFFKDCADLCSDCAVQAISNKKYMPIANNNKLRAEQMANEDFIRRIKVLQGSILRESSQNIDAMDHLKLVTTPGYMSIESISTTEAIENLDQFNKLCENMINSTKSLSNGSDRCVRIGIILNISDDDKDNIDWSFDKIKSQFAEIGEAFLHVQTSLNETRSITVIMCGMEMPIKFVMATYEKFKSRTSKSAKETNFAKTMAGIKTEGNAYDFSGTASKDNTSAASFLNKLNKKNNNNGSGSNDDLSNY